MSWKAFSLIVLCFAVVTTAWAQVAGGRPLDRTSQPEAELQTGISLTRGGLFSEAIPHLLVARGRVSDEYAASFDLSLCYVGTGQFKPAIEILLGLNNSGHGTAAVQNLLAQAYIGDAQPEAGFETVRKAATLTPEDEKLYVLVADACLDHQDYSLGVKVVNLGLRALPRSSRLHYQRGFFLSLLDEFDSGKKDFDLAIALAPESEIAYMAAAQKAVFAGDMQSAVRITREAIKNGHENYALLAILGDALIRSGASPGQPDFDEAKSALEKSVAERPNYAGSQLALGKLNLLEDRPDDAIEHLERARQLDSGNTSVYASLAKAYQRRGDLKQAQEALAVLAKINQAQAEKINGAPGGRKRSYAGLSRGVENEATH